LIIFAVGISAFGTITNPGHAISEIQKCDSDGQILKMSGGNWVCGSDIKGLESIDWSSISNIPSGFADGTDANTQLSSTQVRDYIISSRQIVTLKRSNTNNVQVYCPSGKNLIGGGCHCRYSTLENSWPAAEERWYCECSQYTGEEVTGFAICI
jgi:hypothetical protein